MAVDMQKQRSGETATNAAELYRFMQARGNGRRGGAGRTCVGGWMLVGRGDVGVLMCVDVGRWVGGVVGNGGGYGRTTHHRVWQGVLGRGGALGSRRCCTGAPACPSCCCFPRPHPLWTPPTRPFKHLTPAPPVLAPQKVRAGDEVSSQELLKFAKLFSDELTLDNLER